MAWDTGDRLGRERQEVPPGQNPRGGWEAGAGQLHGLEQKVRVLPLSLSLPPSLLSLALLLSLAFSR